MRHTLRHLRLRAGLLAKFALASLVPIVLLGAVLAHVLRGEIVQRALVNARQSAQLLEGSLVQPELSAADLRAGLSPSRDRRLDRALAPSLADKQIARIKVWNRDDRVVYGSDHTIIGHRFVASDELEAAFAGRTASEISDLRRAENATDRSFGKLLEVYTPLRFGTAGAPAGAFEIYLPYAPIAAAISRDTDRLYLFLVGGLGLLYLALFRIVAGASTRLRRQAQENERLALHDPLTALPNRVVFHDRAQQAILTARRDETCVALLIFDLDRFKEINDTLGHHNGDLLLQEIGRRIESTLRHSDTVARLGGDEFGVLLPSVADADEALAVADKIRRALRQPLALQGLALDLEASVGLALYPEHGPDVSALLQRADVAMYLAKADHSGCALYEAERDEYSPARLALAGELRSAIAGGELVLHYQPKASLADGRIAGVEALVRWQHPERGLVPPSEFVPLAERTGLIKQLTLSVLDQALRQQRAWAESGLDLSVAVNVSARDLLDLDLPDTVAGLLESYGVPGDRFVLEITESVILSDPMRARLILVRLDGMGVRIAIDDFGSGYSSLAYLKRLPIAELKIDRSFVFNMDRDENDAVIVSSTIELARNLGIAVVAEGVETERTWQRLRTLACDEAQGFYLSRPLPADQLVAWVADRAARPATDAPRAALG